MTAMTFTARNIKDAASATCQCAVLPVFTRKRLSHAAQQLDQASSGAIKAALELGDFSGKSGETLMLPGAGTAKRLLLVGCGDPAKFDRSEAREITQSIYRALNATKAADATIHTADLELKNGDGQWLLAYLARHLTAASYRYTETVSKPKTPLKLSRVVVNTGGSIATGIAQRALDQGKNTGLGVNEARHLANLPGNICTPTYLAQQARKLGKDNAKLSVSILEEKKMKELGMGSLLSVSAGSDEPAKLIVMNYKGGKSSQKPYVLVGKGITFDSGGISLKPGAKMDEMKFDMGGAASVFGTMRAITAMALPLNVVAIVAAAENMPSGGATKPGDVVTSMSGKTIEVLNTDAEGRLVLCDALSYAERFKPEAVIDIATLTGACVVALGSHASALYANQDKLADQLLTAGIDSHDRAWRMPLWQEYHKQLNSNFADLANIGGPGGGSITAACFLSQFAEKYHWAHLDIAGSAWDSSPKGATGRPVALLTRYLMDRASK
ncbi:MAG: leucyl aminopeptidase [Halioglobus sp.]